ncbi:MAG: DUF2207 domain-containing protein [Proteobacteria bacterium]|nr:DUF2207 domain-containing protein [Pseudomonadota bacterium]
MNQLLHKLLLLCLLLAGSNSFAQEQILSYHSDIQIAADASMLVTETIRVHAEGQQIRRGIYRDFPTRYSDRLGNSYVVDFEFQLATRDGVVDTWRIENLSNGVRIYVGHPDILLAPGEYTYTLRYRTGRQIGYFPGHDELYWNVTGNGWAFQILQASATVTLPGNISATDITMEGYTGRFGDVGQAYTVSVQDGGASIQTTATLPDAAALTLAMTWPKGIVYQPTEPENFTYLLSANLGLLLALITLVGSTIYLYYAWHRVGRDPESGVIFPHYSPPKGYSPASARYIATMRYDAKAFTAAIVNLAVKNYLLIEKEEDDYTLTRTESFAALAAGEKTILEKLFAEGPELRLETENRQLVMDAIKAHRQSLRRDYLDVYFMRNSHFLIPSSLVAVLVIALVAYLNSLSVALIVVFSGIAAIHVLFAYLLHAPSVKGRLLMDKLERFKLYLSVAEQDDLRVKYPPDKTPELFEQFLPYAIALGVEEAWAEQFTAVFLKLKAETGVTYQPVWYHGHFSILHMNVFASNVTGSMSTAITAASTPPGSSSGSGGGGFSGGGGGGGGGGGW